MIEKENRKKKCRRSILEVFLFRFKCVHNDAVTAKSEIIFGHVKSAFSILPWLMPFT